MAVSGTGFQQHLYLCLQTSYNNITEWALHEMKENTSHLFICNKFYSKKNFWWGTIPFSHIFILLLFIHLSSHPIYMYYLLNKELLIIIQINKTQFLPLANSQSTCKSRYLQYDECCNGVPRGWGDTHTSHNVQPRRLGRNCHKNHTQNKILVYRLCYISLMCFRVLEMNKETKK